jgi:hypothetical protein
MTTAGTPMNADAPPIAADKGRKKGFVISAGNEKRRRENTDDSSAFIGGASAFIGVPRISLLEQKAK